MDNTVVNVLFPIMMVSAGAWVLGLLRYKHRMKNDHPETYRRLGHFPGIWASRYGYSPGEIRALLRHVGFILNGGWRSLGDPPLARLCARMQVIFWIALPLCVGVPVYTSYTSFSAIKKDAVPRSPAQQAARYLNDGYDLWKNGDFEAALTAYDQAVALAPEDDQVYYYRGIALVDAGYPDEAVADFSRAGELNPSFFDAYLRLDQVCAKQKEWRTIIDHWTRFISHNPGHARAYLERAGAYHHSGDQEAALADLKTACDLGEDVGCRYYQKYGS